ncbi:MAG: glycosyltransferase family 39 protein [Dehalococcoidia bacterium]
MAAEAWWLQLAFVVGLAALLRFSTLTDRSLWLDELKVAVVGLGGLDSAVDAAKADVSATPLDYALVAASQEIFGRGEFAVRLPAAIAGVGAVAGLYLLGWFLAGRGVGLTAAILLAVLPGHFWYSQEARFYSLLAFFTVASTLAFGLAVRRGSGWLWGAYGVCVALGLYAGYQAAFVVAVHVAAFALGVGLGWWRLPRTSWLWLGGSLGLAAAAFLPWFLWDNAGASYNYPSPPADAVAQYLTWSFSFGATEVADALPADGAWYVAGLVFATSALAGLLAVRRREPLLCVAAASVVALPFVVLFVVRRQDYFLEERHFVFLLPLASLAVAYATVELIRTRLAAPLGVALLAVFLLLAALGLGDAFKVEHKREDWRSAVRYLEAEMSEGDRLAPNENAELIAYYHDFGTVYGVRSAQELSDFADATEGDAWVFTSLREWRSPYWPELEPALAEGFSEIDFPGIRIFVRPGGR